jgi:hypothetical protein
MSQDPSDPELEAIESALGALAPARSRVDRDRLMFQAGAISVRTGARVRWGWPAIAATLALVAISESVALAVRPGPRVVVVERSAPEARDRPAEPATVPMLTQSPPTQPSGNDGWSAGGGEALGLRRQVLRYGLEGLPDPPSLLTQSAGTEASTALDAGAEAPRLLRRYELNRVLEPGGPS